MRLVRSFLIAALAAVLFVALDRSWPIGGVRIPPPGRLLDPFGGVWAPADTDRVPDGPIEIPGLRAPVTVLWDDRDVPHVFASNEHDLYVAQGWVVARHRLWQMDFQTLAAAGRLSEVVGSATVDRDRLQRRLGVAVGAEEALAASLEEPIARTALEAYAAGVNAWIDRLSDSRLPLEYKLLDDRPRPWSPFRSVLTLRSMAQVLSLQRNDLAQSLLRQRLGRETVEQLFPTHPPFVDPIAPESTPWSFRPVTVPTPAGRFPDLEASGAEGDSRSPDEERSAAIGSNNWVVGPDRAARGRPILAGDPHLPLTLPSVWYEIHLQAPDVDVYGVTLPGVPGVVIGFNREFAWSFTNAYSDVTDWYAVELREGTASEYRYDAAWRPVRWREETVRVRDADPVVDRVAWTHHGPIVAPAGSTPLAPWVPTGAALRWTGHDRSREVSAVLELNRARAIGDLESVLERFRVPGQNVAFAFRDGRFGVIHAGAFPIRWPEQGRYVQDGSDPAFDWHGWVPTEHLPRVIDPDRGFAGSANQPPTNDSYPYWLGWSYERWERGARIHALLSTMDRIEPADMIRMQDDVESEYARKLVPVLLSRLRPEQADGDAHAKMLDALSRWDFRFTSSSVAATLFDRWQQALRAEVWSDDFDTVDARGRMFPRRDVTTAIVTRNVEAWIDDRGTPEVETLDVVVRESFETAVEELEQTLGPFGEGWAWGRYRTTRIPHLAGLGGLGSGRLQVDGQRGVLRAVTSRFGPSWRMVVELGDPPRAWGEYPGGQNGDPASRRYLDGVDAWVRGDVRPLWFPGSPASDDADRFARTILEPAP